MNALTIYSKDKATDLTTGLINAKTHSQGMLMLSIHAVNDINGLNFT
ncbi:hypothetical protein P4S67_14975 [Pseudoalteromonas sp. B137]